MPIFIFLAAMFLGLVLPPVVLIIITGAVVLFFRRGLGVYTAMKGRDGDAIIIFFIYAGLVFMWIAHGVGWLKTFIG